MNIETTTKYRYNLSSTKESSEELGNCDVCGEPATEVFLQGEEREYRLDAPDDTYYARWTQHNCRSYFGHKECLINTRRN